MNSTAMTRDFNPYRVPRPAPVCTNTPSRTAPVRISGIYASFVKRKRHFYASHRSDPFGPSGFRGVCHAHRPQGRPPTGEGFYRGTLPQGNEQISPQPASGTISCSIAPNKLSPFWPFISMRMVSPNFMNSVEGLPSRMVSIARFSAMQL